MFDDLCYGAGHPIWIVATPVQYIDNYGSWQKGNWALLVASDRLRVGRRALTGTKIPIDFEFGFIRSLGVRLQGGHGPLFELQVVTDGGGTFAILFYDLDAATAVFDAIQAATRPPAPVESPVDDAAQQQATIAAARIRSFMQSLAPTFSTSARQPFGEETGLDEALGFALMHFPTMDDVRRAGHMMAVTFLTADDPELSDADLNEAMGARADWNVEQMTDRDRAVSSLAGACQSFLGQFEESGANMWELWRSNDEVAREFLCWLAVAQLRLHAMGRMEDPLS